MRFFKQILAVIVVLFSFCANAVPLPDAMSGYVNDFANKLSDAQKADLNQKLASFQDKSKVTIVFITVSSVKDYGYNELHELGMAAFEKWKIGDKKLSSGILIIVAGNAAPYKVRIMPGRGVEGAVPDILAKRIIEQQMKPVLHSGTPDAYIRGLTTGADALMTKTVTEFVQPPVQSLAATNNKAKDYSVEYFFGVVIFLCICILGLVAFFNWRYNRKQEAKRKVEQQTPFRPNYEPYVRPAPQKRYTRPERREEEKKSDWVTPAVVASSISSSRDDDRKSSSSNDSPSYSSPSSGGGSSGAGAGD